MATNFPTNIDTFTEQTSSDLITSAKWNNLQDSIEALEAKLGADNSTVTTSHDYKLAELAAAMGLTQASLGETQASLGETQASLGAAQNALCPVGSIVAYVPGYFTDGSNAGFTHQMVSANTVAAVNALLNSSGWYVCDGAALNDADSGIFNGAGRYLPNLTDDRFFMGDTVAGGIGGANSNNIAHTHTTGNHALTVAEMPEHYHALNYFTLDGTTSAPIDTGSLKLVNVATGGINFGRFTTPRGSGQAHNHGSTGSAGSSSLENRPKYLSCFYIMRVK
jgi:microcystin-dependent protein